MRLAKIGWIMSFVLPLVLLTVFVFHRGILIRADVDLPIFGGPPWPVYCEYLALGGTFRETPVVADDQENPAATFCPFLRPQDRHRETQARAVGLNFTKVPDYAATEAAP